MAHDNNRDGMGLSLNLTRNVLKTFLGWKAQVLHDLHESVPYLYDNTVGDEPYKTIEAGTVVEFEMVYGDHRGPRATFVQRLDEKEATHVGHGE